jgi:putative PIN family toxin of toxin-antitoxin system
MRVVLDTNILISALVKPDGLEAKTVALALDGGIVPYVSAELWDEYQEVLFREKFAAFSGGAWKLLAELGPRVARVQPVTKATWSNDEQDNRVLECAAEARAHYLVTGNLRHFPEDWQGTKIVNARAFWNEVAQFSAKSHSRNPAS